MIYFDSAATTKPLKEVIETYNKMNDEYWFNPSSMYKNAVFVKTLIDRASKSILNTLNLTEKNIYYTSGATEANNLAIMGVTLPYKNQNKHLITTEIEHASVYNVFQTLEKEGFRVTYLKCQNGIIDLNELENALTKDTILVSIMWVNNIIGSINPMKKIVEIVKNRSHAKLHVDIVQGVCKIKPDFDFNDFDLMTLTFHKIEGLKGIGALIANKNLQIKPLFYGGHQQNQIRPGTYDAALIVASSKALRINYEKIDCYYHYVHKLYNYLIDKLIKLPFIDINKKGDYYSPYVLSISLKKIKGETVMHYLEENNIIVGIGSACNEKSKTLERSVFALTNSVEKSYNMIRISLSHHNTYQEIDYLIEKLQELGNR
jgi:cysteine desulfurase